MIFGIAIGGQLKLQGLEDQNALSAHARNVIAAIPTVAGAILAFVAGTRLSMVLRARYLLALGTALVIGATAGPLLVAHVLAGTENYVSTAPLLISLFVFRIVGIIFFSTGLLRFYWRSSPKA